MAQKKTTPSYEQEEQSVIRYDHPEVVQELEKKYPQMTDEFKRIMFTQYELFCLKQSNYGPDNIAAGTGLKNSDDIQLALIGLWFRMNDKIQRLKNLIVLGKKNNVQGENTEDSIMDLSVYGIIAQIVKNGKWGK